MTQQQAQHLVQKILANEASQEEKNMLRQYLADHANSSELADQLLPLKELETTSDSVLPADMEERILRPITGDSSLRVLPPKHRRFQRSLLRLSVAAAVLVAVCLIAFRLFITSSSLQPTTTALLDTIMVPAGNNKTITLSDGTRIHLNGATTLCMPVSFSGTTREVYLDGEAFFEVSRDPDHPFIVHCPFFTTTVLGTSFNIKSSSGNQLLSEIAVATGKVRVAITGQKAADSIALLTPGEKASYLYGSARGLLTTKTDVAGIGSWKDRNFYYDQTPLSDILSDLERSYGLHFRIKNPAVLSCTYSVTFRNMPVEEIIKTLALMSQIKFNKKETLVEVSGHACN